MQISDVIALQKFMRPGADVLLRNDVTRPVDNAVIIAVAAQKPLCSRPQKVGQHIALLRPFTGFSTQKDRSRFGIGLQIGKRPVGENKIGFSFGNGAQAMPAGNPLPVEIRRSGLRP